MRTLWMLGIACSGNDETTDSTPPRTDSDTAETEEPRTVPDVVSRGLTCYLGPERQGDVCLDTLELPDWPSDYLYPPPFQGSAQYRAPVRLLDLAGLDPQQSLAPNFVLGEVARVDDGRYAVVQAHAIAKLQAVRDEVGRLVVNSGYRSPGYNRGLPGSATSSRHLYGDGFDLDPGEATLTAVADACYAEGAGYVEVYTSHVHCDWRDDPLDAGFFDGTRSTRQPVEESRSATIVDKAGIYTAPAHGFDEGEPLREWTATDAYGNVLATATGPTFIPPEHATTVQVVVGRVVSVHRWR